MINPSNFTFNYSGGQSNNNAYNSLGGEPSALPIQSNNIFNDISNENAKSGITQYKCIYLINNSNTDTLFSPSISVSYPTEGDVNVLIGFNFQNEIQQITITNGIFVTGGSFTLNAEIVVNWNSSLINWALNFQNAIQLYFENATVTGSTSNNNVIFQVNFMEYKHYNLMTLSANTLTPSSSINITENNVGSPINSTAGVIDVDTTSPYGITFSNSANLNDMMPNDIVPIWLQRTCPKNATIMADGFNLNVSDE